MGTNNTGAGIYWKPVITYTEIEQEFDPTRKEYKRRMRIQTVTVCKVMTAGILCTRTVRAHT